MVQNFQLASYGSRVELARAEPAKFWLGSTRVTKNGLAPTLRTASQLEYEVDLRRTCFPRDRVDTHTSIHINSIPTKISSTLLSS